MTAGREAKRSEEMGRIEIARDLVQARGEAAREIPERKRSSHTGCLAPEPPNFTVRKPLSFQPDGPK